MNRADRENCCRQTLIKVGAQQANREEHVIRAFFNLNSERVGLNI